MKSSTFGLIANRPGRSGSLPSPFVLIILALFLICIPFGLHAATNTGQDSISFVKGKQPLGNTRSFGLAVADFDRDGDQDVFFPNYIGPSQLWINDGSGQFTQSAEQFVVASTESAPAHDADAADLNGDSFPDLFVIYHHAPNRVFLNDGSGGFNDNGQSIGSANDFPQTIQMIDVDRDGDIDAMIYNSNAPNQIWLNDGSGQFSKADFVCGNNNTNGIYLADFNNDSFPDMYLSIRFAANQVWMNDRTGHFARSGQSLGGEATGCCSGDVDGDGDIDLVVLEPTRTVIWMNDKNSGVFNHNVVLNGGGFKCVAFDADGDNDLDIATAHIGEVSRLWVNGGSESFTSLDSVFGSSNVLSIMYADFDGDGDLDVVTGRREDTGGNTIYFNTSTK